MENIEFISTGHAAWEQNSNKDLGLDSIRYFSFGTSAIIQKIIVNALVLRWSPEVYGEPAHFIVQAYDETLDDFVTIKELDTPKYSKDRMFHEIELTDVKTSCLRLICDKEHEVTHSHGEQWANPDIVPFGILNSVKILGKKTGPSTEPIYNPPLLKKDIKPGGIENVRIKKTSHMVSYESSFFKAAFSLRRPIITHLGWDDMGEDRCQQNLLPNDSVWIRPDVNSICGPYIKDFTNETKAQFFTGSVCVLDDYIEYSDIRMNENFALTVRFTIYEKGMKVTLKKYCHQDYTAIEADDWRFVFDAKTAVTSFMAIPDINNTRTGIIKTPFVLNAPSFGTIVVSKDDGFDDTTIQVDSFRAQTLIWGGAVIGAYHDNYGFMHFKKGIYTASFSMTCEQCLPYIKENLKAQDISKGVLRNFSSGLGFRPELAGFSNNAISCNCHLAQYGQADLCVYAQPFSNGIDPNLLMEFTLELSLRGGPGYGDNRDMYIDSDPSVLIAIGRIYQRLHNHTWVIKMWDKIKAVLDRIIKNIDESSGLLICTTLTGNSGSKRWSSNGMDVLSFGHFDAYSNMLAYRGMMSLKNIAGQIGDQMTQLLCEKSTAVIKSAYEKYLVNPKTGLVSGWRSKDGEHHDYFFTFINYMAVSIDILSRDRSMKIMQILEDKMEQIGLDYFYYGIPMNLLSIQNKDAPTGNDYKREDGLDKFGIYLNGSMSPSFCKMYISCLLKYGYYKKAQLVCDHLRESFADSIFVKGCGYGSEFLTWEGRPCGYEGTLIGQFPIIPYLSVQEGTTKPLSPEWWYG